MEYYNHLKITMACALALFVGAIKTTIHAIYPNICITSTNDTIEHVQTILKQSSHKES